MTEEKKQQENSVKKAGAQEEKLAPSKRRGWFSGIFWGAAAVAGFAAQPVLAAGLTLLGIRVMDDFSRGQPFYKGISPTEVFKGAAVGVMAGMAINLATQLQDINQNHVLAPVNETIAQAQKTLGDSWQPAVSLQKTATDLAAQGLADYYKAQGECLETAQGSQAVSDCLKQPGGAPRP